MYLSGYTECKNVYAWATSKWLTWGYKISYGPIWTSLDTFFKYFEFLDLGFGLGLDRAYGTGPDTKRPQRWRTSHTKLLKSVTLHVRFMFEFEEIPRLSVRDLVTLLRGNLYKATNYLHLENTVRQGL